jgi:hypothetical protein
MKQSLERREITIPEIYTTTSQFQLQSYPNGTQHHPFRYGNEGSLNGGSIDPTNHNNVHWYPQEHDCDGAAAIQSEPIVTSNIHPNQHKQFWPSYDVRCLTKSPTVYPQVQHRLQVNLNDESTRYLNLDNSSTARSNLSELVIPLRYGHDGADLSTASFNSVEFETPFQYGRRLLDIGHPSAYSLANSSELLAPFQYASASDQRSPVDVSGHPLSVYSNPPELVIPLQYGQQLVSGHPLPADPAYLNPRPSESVIPLQYGQQFFNMIG